MTLERRSIGGRYELRAPLGHGGFATVYSAWDTLDERRVALKLLTIPDHLSESARAEFVRRFQDEARITRKAFQGLRHVRQVLDMGVADEAGEKLPWMAMELLEGETLHECLLAERARGVLRSEVEVVSLLRPVVEVVAFAHARGIVHRDLKPANLFLARAAGETIIKVLDFGIAKVIAEDEAPSGDTHTQSAFQMFSPAYGAPEQFSGKKTGKYTDVFALGLLFTELLSGKPPLAESGDKTECMMTSCDRRERPTPKNRGGQVSDAMEAFVLKAVAVKEAERYPNAEAMLEALDGMSPAGPKLQAPVATSFMARVDAVSPATGNDPRESFERAVAAAAASTQETSFADRLDAFEPPGERRRVEREVPGSPRAAWGRLLGAGLGGVGILAVVLLGVPRFLAAAHGASPQGTVDGGQDADDLPRPLELRYTDTVVGTGPIAKLGSAIDFRLSVAELSGREAARAHVIEHMTLGKDSPLEELDRAIAGMGEGGVRTIRIPPPRGRDIAVGQGLDPKSELLVTITLLGVDRPDAGSDAAAPLPGDPALDRLVALAQLGSSDAGALGDDKDKPVPGPFDATAAEREKARVTRALASCQKVDGPSGTGGVSYTLDPSGRVRVESISVQAPFEGTKRGACLRKLVAGIHVPAFRAPPLGVDGSILFTFD